MIGRWLVRRRERAASEWRMQARLSRLLSPTPIARHAEHYELRARRALRRADRALDLWTWRERRHG